MTIELFIAGWVICGVITYRLGMWLLTKDFPDSFNAKWEKQDKRIMMVLSILGPIGLVSTLLFGAMKG